MITISISLTVFEIRPPKNLESSSLIFQGHPRSNFIASNESPYMISYMSVIQTKSVSVIVFEISQLKHYLTFQGQRSNLRKEVYFQANLNISISASNDDDLNIKK